MLDVTNKQCSLTYFLGVHTMNTFILQHFCLFQFSVVRKSFKTKHKDGVRSFMYERILLPKEFLDNANALLNKKPLNYYVMVFGLF